MSELCNCGHTEGRHYISDPPNCSECHCRWYDTGKNPPPGGLDTVYNRVCEERDRYKAVVEWIASKTNLLFAECSDAEEIVKRCADALNPKSMPPEGK